MKFAKILFLLCLPAIIWYTPLNAENQKQPAASLATSNQINFSPWDLLKYENLSYDNITNFIWEIFYGDTLQSILCERQVDEIIEFVIFLASNGIAENNPEGRASLEEDIKWLRGEANTSDLDHEESASWFFEF